MRKHHVTQVSEEGTTEFGLLDANLRSLEKSGRCFLFLFLLYSFLWLCILLL